MMILIAIQSIAFASSLLLWAYRFSVRRKHGNLLRKRTPHTVSPLGVVDVGTTVLIWFMFQLFGLIPVCLFMDIEFSQLSEMENLSAEQLLEFSGYMMLMQLAATFIAMVCFIVRYQRVAWLGTANRFRDDVVVGMAAALMLIPVVMLIQLVVTQLIPYEHPTLDSLSDNFSFGTACWAWIAAVGVAPIAEEFFFRGVLQGWLERVFDYDEPHEIRFIGGHLNPETANAIATVSAQQKLIQNLAPILITSVIFAGVHFGQGPAPIPLFFLSLGLGYLFRQTGSFWPCVIVHLVLNAMSMTILTLSLIYPELAPAEAEPAATFLFF